MSEHDIKELLRSASFFQFFSEKTLSAFANCTIRMELKAGKILFHKGDSADNAFFIAKGYINIFTASTEGKRIVLNTLSKGSFFGELSLIDSLNRTASAEAKTDCVLYSISQDNFFKISKAFSPEEWLFLCQNSIRILRRSSSQIEAAHFYSADRRLAKILLDISRESGPTIAISQDTLAEMAGLTREVTNRNLSRLEKENLISRKYKSIDITNLDTLKDYIGEDNED